MERSRACRQRRGVVLGRLPKQSRAAGGHRGRCRHDGAMPRCRAAVAPSIPPARSDGRPGAKSRVHLSGGARSRVAAQRRVRPASTSWPLLPARAMPRPRALSVFARVRSRGGLAGWQPLGNHWGSRAGEARSAEQARSVASRPGASVAASPPPPTALRRWRWSVGDARKQRSAARRG